MTIFNQTKYSGFLGNTKYSIKGYGCTTACVTMVHNYKNKKFIDLDKAAKMLSYTKDGLLIWSSLKKLGLQLVSRVYKYDKKLIDDTFKSDNKYVILQVNKNHWVWVIGRYIPFLGYRIADPLKGDKAYTNRYKNITGFAIIK
jgi:ABC-type bacteriocin/lantibiotic exporter with double-glycine peptidase domain